VATDYSPDRPPIKPRRSRRWPWILVICFGVITLFAMFSQQQKPVPQPNDPNLNATVDRLVAAGRADPAIRACLQKKEPRFRGIDTENPDDVAGLVNACAPAGRAFIKRMCEKDNSTCRVSAGLLMFLFARDAVLKRRRAPN
jgi:hypothetical protein